MNGFGRGAAPATAWHALEADAVLAQLGSDAAAGLSGAAVPERAARSGPNALPEPPRRSLLGVFLHQFKSPLIYILFVAAALALTMGHWGLHRFVRLAGDDVR